MHLVGFIIRIFHNARSRERQTVLMLVRLPVPQKLGNYLMFGRI